MQKKYQQWLAIELIIVGIGFLSVRILPSDFFLTHDYHLCLWKWIFHFDCPGCGSLRALSQLAHGDVMAAWNFNKFIFLELIVLLGINVYWCLKMKRK